MENAIRNKYEKLGVENYYRQQGQDYENPHFLQIEKIIIQNESRIDYSAILDFCCGSGEVSEIVRQLGYTNTTASDPFTQEAYKKRFGEACLSWSFEEVIQGKMEGDYSAIISSFAMHLCPEEQLFPLCYQLFQHTFNLVIITPHKRPVLENLEGISLEYEDFVFTPKGKKVFLKSYSSTFR